MAAAADYAYEAGLVPSAITLTRTGALAHAVTVVYILSGAAAPGTDFAPLPGYLTTSGTVTLAAGQASTNLAVQPLADASAEGPEAVTLQLAADPLYLVGSPAAATVTILDDDVAPTVTVNSPAAGSVAIPSGVGLLLDATVLHNGLPNPPAAVTQVWAQVSGPGAATLASSNDWKTSTAQFPTPGTYVLKLTATAGGLSASSNVTVQVGSFGAPAWANYTVGTVSPSPVFSVTNGTNSIVSAGKPGLVGAVDVNGVPFALRGKRRLTIGADPRNRVIVQGVGILPRHAEVRPVGNPKRPQVVIRSLDPKNPVIVNGLEVTSHTLENGDTLRIGDQTLTYVGPDRFDDPAQLGGDDNASNWKF